MNVAESSSNDITEVAQMFPVNVEVFSLNTQFYGWKGKVIGNSDDSESIGVLVELENTPEPDLTPVTGRIDVSLFKFYYFNGYLSNFFSIHL